MDMLFAVGKWYEPNSGEMAWFVAGILAGKILKGLLDKMGVH